MALKESHSVRLVSALARQRPCRSSVSAHGDACRPNAEEPEGLSVTRWTDKTELFAEYPPLVVGETSRFAIHLTRLDYVQGADRGTRRGPSDEAAAEPAEVFRVDAPSRPGIFGVDVKPAHAGSASSSSCCVQQG